MTRQCRITKTFEFEAAHQLRWHDGKCSRLHGHSYRLDVTVFGPIKEEQTGVVEQAPDVGMVLDFGRLSITVKAMLLDSGFYVQGESAQPQKSVGLDHSNLNEVTGIYTTAENLAHFIFEKLDAVIPHKMLQSIELWETRTGRVQVTRTMINDVARGIW